MKKAQFFIVALVLLAFSFFAVFGYLRSIDSSSVALFEHSSSFDLRNIHHAVDERNDWLETSASSAWWNLNWAHRKDVTINNLGTNPAEIDMKIASGRISSCVNELVVVNSTGGTESVSVTQGNQPCNLSFDAKNGETYYIYYGNLNAAQNNPTPASGNIDSTYTLGAEQDSQVCTHLEYIYQLEGKFLQCAAANVNNNRINYSINFSAPDLEFKGYIY